MQTWWLEVPKSNITIQSLSNDHRNCGRNNNPALRREPSLARLVVRPGQKFGDQFPCYVARKIDIREASSILCV